MSKDLFEQAIADAKKLKAISLANAKEVIEEAFAPKIQEMFRLKLSEMEESEHNVTEELRKGVHGNFEEWKKSFPEGTEFESKNNYMVASKDGEELGKWNPVSKQGMHADDPQYKNLEEKMHDETGDTMEEATLDEILAELELEESEEPLEEAKGDSEEEGEKEETEEKGDEAESEEPATGDEKVSKLTVDQLTQLVQDAVAMVMGEQGGGAEAEGDLESADEVPGGGVAGDEEAITLETISLDEILAELEENSGEVVEEEVVEEEKAQLEEAVETINYLKAQLNEVNLLNAKLLYVNKIFKSKSLTESQKVTVITAFDRATTTKEAKNIYETLVDSLTPAQTAKKAPIKESLGFASKPIGSAPAKPIVEADAYVYRMQQLAGIKKPNI